MNRPKDHNYPMTLVVRGHKDALQALRRELRILAIRKDVSLSSLVVSILMNYVHDQKATGEAQS